MSRVCHGWRTVPWTVGERLQPDLAPQPGAVLDATSMTSVWSVRPNTGDPQVSRLSFVCSGPFTRSQSGNVMLTLLLHHDDWSRTSRYATQARALAWSVALSKVSGSSA